MPIGSEQYAARRAAQEMFLIELEKTGSTAKALAACERTKSTLKMWLQRYPDFKSRYKITRERLAEAAVERVQAEARGESWLPDDATAWKRAGFGPFRKRFFNMDTPDFQLEMVHAYEATKPGDITMVLVPPEHGKTTLFEDYASMKLAVDPQYRFTVGTEAQPLARRILRRVSNRMRPDGPFPEYATIFGPMHPEDDRIGRGNRQVFGADQFDVYFKRIGDERDYSMVALGATSQIAGTRTDHLHVDDITSMKNVNQTEGLLQTFRQDWLSRPGENGRTTINGTRVDVGDFYERLIEEIGPEILTVIRKPAIVYDVDLQQHVPLWPEKFTMENLRRIREKVGEEAWARNYMQQPMAKTLSLMAEEVIDECKDPLIDVIDYLPGGESGMVLSCDPSIGGRNVWMVAEFTNDWLMPMWFEVEERLTAYDQIFATLYRLLRRFTSEGVQAQAVIFESVAFQRGLTEDRRLKELEVEFGFHTIPHLTGKNKIDPIIGVPAMPTSFRRGEVIIPWGGEQTQLMMQMFIDELMRWRPMKRGTELTQDMVMAFWFAWRWWSNNRVAPLVSLPGVSLPQDHDIGPLPFPPTTMPAPTRWP